MTVEENRLCAQYFYNSVIEFIYFLITYLRVYEAVSLSDLYRYVQFFKAEVDCLISSFEGKSNEDKLFQLLNILDCFVVLEHEVRFIDYGYLKDDIYEELLLSRSVDLILKGLNNVNDICKNLNADGIFEVKKENLLHIFEKYSFISVSKGSVVTLHHAHGLLGFEDYLYNSVTGYFYNILYHGKILSYNEVISHSKSLTFCGMNNVLGIFSILNSSPQFNCQDGYVLLRKKRKKSPKKKALCIEDMGASFSSRSLSIGQIVYVTFGNVLHQWTGEIGTLTASLGVIYCVVDFTNGHQGVFNIYFSKTALKSIAGIDDLKNYLNVRDTVEFDAEHYTGKSFDRCWKATRVKLLSSKKIQYDESLCAKLNENTELQRNNCMNYMCCAKNLSMNCIVNGSPKLSSDLLTEKETSECDFPFLTLNNKDAPQEISQSIFVPIKNTQIPDYLIIFGHVSLLMKDKGVVTAKHGDEYCSIFFLKESVYHPNKPEHFVNKGQKVLTFIPYAGKLESFSIATLIYGLSEKEADESGDISPQEFTVKTFLWNELKDLCNGFCCNCRFLNGSQIVKMESFNRDIKYKIQIAELYDFIIEQYKVPLAKDKLQLLLHYVCREKLDVESSSNKIFHFFVKLSRYLNKYTNCMKINRKLKLFFSENDIKPEEPSAITLKAKAKSLDFVAKSRLTNRSHSCDLKGNSLGSLNSYKTCSTGSSEVFYSCDSTRSNTPMRCSTPMRSSTPNYLSNSFLSDFEEETDEIPEPELSPTVLHDGSKTLLTNTSLESVSTECFSESDLKIMSPTEEMFPQNLNKSEVPELELTPPLPAVLNDECQILCMRYRKETNINAEQLSKSDLKASKYHKYFSLQSVPCLKVKKRKKAVFPYSLKPPCNNCARSFVETSGSLSLMSPSCYFFNTRIDGTNVVLPFPKTGVSEELQEKITVGSRADITVVPSVMLNLSHILKIKLVF